MKRTYLFCWLYAACYVFLVNAKLSGEVLAKQPLFDCVMYFGGLILISAAVALVPWAGLMGWAYFRRYRALRRLRRSIP